MADLAPFDPGDPFDAMSESFRRQISEMILRALDTTIYREMENPKQLECFVVGVVTGLIGVCFAHIKPESRDVMMRAIEIYLPQARLNVERMING